MQQLLLLLLLLLLVCCCCFCWSCLLLVLLLLLLLLQGMPRGDARLSGEGHTKALGPLRAPGRYPSEPAAAEG